MERSLIAGGQLPGGSRSTNAELYVPASGTLEYAGEMTAGRHSHRATKLPDDTVLLTGGYTFWSYPSLGPVSTAEVYKPRWVLPPDWLRKGPLAAS